MPRKLELMLQKLELILYKFELLYREAYKIRLPISLVERIKQGD